MLPQEPLKPFRPAPPPVQPPEPVAPAGGQPSPGPPPQPYDFITHPTEPARSPAVSPLSMLSGNSLPIRALLIAGGLLILVIIVVLIKGVLGGSGSLTPFVSIAQDQQELIHLATNGSQQQGQAQALSVNDQNFAATSQLSLASSQSAITTYLTSNGYKVKAKSLNLKISSTLDTQLTNAIAAGTYDQTFQSIMKTEITGYISDLKQVYAQTNGKVGHALLNSDYNQAQLLLTQLNSPTG